MTPGETRAARARRAARLGAALARAYPGATCSLDHRNPFELWAATVLSAQCTDARVNRVTPELFRRCPDPEALAAIPLEELQELIRSTGFFRNKARSLKLGAARIVSEFSGRLPETMEALLTLPGVARKTANVVLGNAFGKAEGIVVDTHVGRLARRMGLTAQDDPVRVERDLMALFPKEEWTALSHRLIHHGRSVCTARAPACGVCPLARLCPRVGVGGGK